MEVSHKNFVGANPKFVLSALSQFSPKDMIALVDEHNIEWQQRELGQLFCKGSARQIIDMLLALMGRFGVVVKTNVEVRSIGKRDNGFFVASAKENITCSSLVVACGAKSIPKMGASNFGYKIGEQFDLNIFATRPGLVPLTFDPDFLARTAPLAGIGIKAKVTHKKTSFTEALLFTHRGLSGPAILQISSYWREGDEIKIDLLPDINSFEQLKEARNTHAKQDVLTFLSTIFPKRVAQMVIGENGGKMGDMSNKKLQAIAEAINNWRIKPTGSEGYRTAEVTLGGIDTKQLNPKTLEVKNVPGLYFIGEVVDVTGWLGGYNFQWAWSSGFAAGQSA
ncbi:Uncharacterized protein YhiN [hydrothermal vent metagenome]|uniref:Uncharacterized protein YhiN n=1 Tax=hydrothermal vent metagenome TaxID=652676 RepID=A0A3B0T787_9ZZZZ